MKFTNLIKRLIFHKHRIESITEVLHEREIYTPREFFAYDILKETVKIVRQECQINPLRYAITEQS